MDPNSFFRFFFHTLYTLPSFLYPPEDLLTSHYPGQCSESAIHLLTSRSQATSKGPSPEEGTLFFTHVYSSEFQMLLSYGMTFPFGWWNNLQRNQVSEACFCPPSCVPYPANTPARATKVGPGSKSDHVAVMMYEWTHQHHEAQRKTHFPDVYLWLLSL